jgi:hypothetical protein
MRTSRIKRSEGVKSYFVAFWELFHKIIYFFRFSSCARSCTIALEWKTGSSSWQIHANLYLNITRVSDLMVDIEKM